MANVTKVVNRRREKFDVYIGRGSIWGNPYSHSGSAYNVIRVETREEAIECYEDWIYGQPILLEQLPKLVGKRLGCWCKPYPCHGDVLVKLIKERGLE